MKRQRHVVIKGSSLPVLRIVVRDGDMGSLRSEVANTVENARPLLSEAIAVLDLRERGASQGGAREIVEAVREARVRLAAVLIGEGNERGPLADLDLPVIEVPLSTRDRSGGSAIQEQAAATAADTTSIDQAIGQTVEATSAQQAIGQTVEATSAQQANGQTVEPTSAQQAAEQTAESPTEPDLAPAYLTRPLRSGQRFYAQGRDAVVAAPTSRGSELIADGSIYAFSSIRGRALAGASGNTSARIIASHLDAELVAVAGVYRMFEADDLKALGSGPVSVALSLEADGSERLTVATLPPSSYMKRR
jgi:septum site-determining protein MinC